MNIYDEINILRKTVTKPGWSPEGDAPPIPRSRFSYIDAFLSGIPGNRKHGDDFNVRISTNGDIGLFWTLAGVGRVLGMGVKFTDKDIQIFVLESVKVGEGQMVSVRESMGKSFELTETGIKSAIQEANIWLT